MVQNHCDNQPSNWTPQPDDLDRGTILDTNVKRDRPQLSRCYLG